MILDAKIVSTNTDSEVYHSIGSSEQRGTHGFVMSNHSLKEFAHCPARWLNGYNPPESEAKNYGELLDCLLLTPEVFPKKYVVQPKTYPAPATHQLVKKGEIREGDPIDWNGNATYCKEWKAAHAHLKPISESDLGEAKSAVASVLNDPIIASLIECSDRQVFLSGSWQDKHTKIVFPIKALLDLVPRWETEWAGNLADLKTTRNASKQAWARFAWQTKYFQQAAFYLDFYCAASGEERDTFLFVIQENFKPYTVAKRMVSQRLLELGRIQYQSALGRYAHCLQTGEWPDYDSDGDTIQGWSLVDAEVWMDYEIQRIQVAPLSNPSSTPEPQPGSDEVDDIFH